MMNKSTHDSGVNGALLKSWIKKQFGEEGLSKIRDKISPDAKKMLTEPVANEWYASNLLPEIYLTIHNKFGKKNPRILVEYGRFAAEESTSNLLRYLVKFISIDTAIQRMRTFWKHYHKGGEIRAIELKDEAGRKRRLISILGYEPGDVGCQVQEGYFLYIAEKTGVKSPKVEKKTCIYHGDADCSWELSWDA